jgi:rod shape-determining protein MreD
MNEEGEILTSIGFIFILLILLIIQNTLVRLISIEGISPDLILIFILYWSGQRSRLQGVIVGFIGGLLQDLAGADAVGVFALSKSIALYVACSFPWGRVERNILPMGVALFAASFAHYIVFFLFQLRNTAAGFPALLLRYGIPSMFYTTALGLLIYVFIEWLKRKQKRKRR